METDGGPRGKIQEIIRQTSCIIPQTAGNNEAGASGARRTDGIRIPLPEGTVRESTLWISRLGCRIPAEELLRARGRAELLPVIDAVLFDPEGRL